MKDIPVSIPKKPTRFLDRLRAYIRTQGLAYRTEQTYIQWIRQFIYFHNKRHPEEMGCIEIKAFLDHLVLSRNVSVNTQRTALNALVFLYKRFMDKDIGDIGMVRANKNRHIPMKFLDIHRYAGTQAAKPRFRLQPGLLGNPLFRQA